MIEDFLKRLAETLDKRRIPYMIIGGQAALIHGRARLTQDVDVTLGVDTDQLEAVLGICRALKWGFFRDDPEEFVERTKVLPVRDPGSKLRIDFIFSSTPYERQAIERAATIRMAGYPVRFATAEDLIIHKVFAGRAIDVEDARAVVVRHGDRLDRAYVRRWLKALQEIVEGDRDLMTVWKQLTQGLQRL